MADLEKYLDCTPENAAYVESLPKIYLIGCWMRFGVREYPNTLQVDEKGFPLVYDLDDHNGYYEEYVLRPIHEVTTGQVYAWSTDKETAQSLADMLNEGRGKSSD